MSITTELPAQQVILHVPDTLYQCASSAAALSNQPVEQFMVGALANGIGLLADLPDEILDDMAALVLLNDAALWRVARETVAPDRYARLDELLSEKSRRTLTSVEQAELDALMNEYEHVVLRRAQAAVLLKQRGYDLASPNALNESSPPLA
jgi:hypothetical protein